MDSKDHHERGSEERSTGRKLLLTVLALGLIGIVAGFGTWSAFSSTTANVGSSFSTGTVTLTDDDLEVAMLSLSNAKPGDADTSCINVTYTGSLPATVRLYGATTGTGLDEYLNLTVTRGTIAVPAFDSCAAFVADVTNYTGAGAGVMYSGTLEDFADSYAAGLVDPTSGSPESWTNPENHAYRFTVSVVDDDDAQGLNAGQTFTWEARSA
ncbi:MAG: hypothetical protein WD770_09620 [Actinomycetota bacterium]